MSTTGQSTGGSAAVLMIHGLGGTQFDLGSMHKILQRAGFTTHSLTLPGHGTQPEDLVNVRAEDWIDAVSTLYADLDARYETLHVCGMCMGALLAIELVKRKKHSKGRLVALAPPIYIDGWATPWYVGLRRFLYWLPPMRTMRVEEEDPYGIKNDLIRGIVKAKFERGEAFHYRWVPLACVEQVDRLRGWVMSGLDAIKCPVLVCHAREDELTSPKSAAFLAREIGEDHTRVELLDNSYHMICVDNDRDLVARRILEHFGADADAALSPQRPRNEGPRMNHDELKKLAEEYFGALKAQQYETLIRLFASDVMWHQPGSSEISGDHAGRSALVNFFSKLMELSGGTLAFSEVGSVAVTDRLAASPVRFSAQREGKSFDGDATMVIRGAEGRVAEVWHFAKDIAAADAFWGGSATAATAGPAESEVAASIGAGVGSAVSSDGSAVSSDGSAASSGGAAESSGGSAASSGGAAESSGGSAQSGTPSAASRAASHAPAPTSAATLTSVDLETGDMDTRFKRAADASRSLSKRPDSTTLLTLYALYKQASLGDASGERPGMIDPVGRAKFDAWEKRRGTSVEQAKTEYVALVKSLIG